MEQESIYGNYLPVLQKIMASLVSQIRGYNEAEKKDHEGGVYEHLSFRIKSEESMRGKCRLRNLPETPRSALTDITDAIGLRIVTGFVDDIYTNIRHIRELPGCSVITEKDYVKHAKPNGYRSYHLILEVTAPEEDVLGNTPGHFFAEIQLRTIAMDSWASLEHQLKYKHNIQNTQLIVSELKRCADELASCDVSMQTIRDLIREDP